MTYTRDEIVAALNHSAWLSNTHRSLLSWLAARVGEGQEGWRNQDGMFSAGPHTDHVTPNWHRVLVIDISDGGKQTTADEILAKMKPLPQAPDDGGKQP